jgi:hypothetical protein
MDLEVYGNYFLALFMTEQGKFRRFEIFDSDDSSFNQSEILELVQHPDVEIVTFNGNSYDVPILTFALVTPDTKLIKAASDRIIVDGIRQWEFYKNEGLKAPKINHVDLIEVAPGQVGLKIYGGRLGSKWLKELPIAHDATLSREDVALIRQYCRNDTLVTQMLYNKLKEQIDLRASMSEAYDVDLRSKSDAQIAEAVLKAEYERITGEPPAKVLLSKESFFYDPPKYIKFSTNMLRDVLDTVRASEMVVDSETGHVKMPKAIADLKITLGGSNYKLGIGGLHSQESEVAHRSDKDTVLIDRDVESYYPRMMLNMDMQPGGFGEYFNQVYGGILEERLAAKHAKDMVKSNALKIVLNGTFGKTSNKYSTLYSPEFMIRTTITGQLTLLMLIEMLEAYGVPVVSANTDGIVIKCPREKRDDVNYIIERWEVRTGLKTEEAVYRALYSRDVNNYIAVKENGSVKAKGVYAPVSLSKNPQVPICAEAVIAYLTQQIPLSVTIGDCPDISKFLTLRTVNGGAEKNGERLGRVVRWYYAKGETGAIHYVSNGNTVPRTEGAKPLMLLPDKFPSDMDYDWYLQECEEILMSVGARPRPFVEKLPRKNSKAWKELLQDGKIREIGGGKWGRVA